MKKSFKYRLYPNQQQEEMFAKHFGCYRFVFNKGLETKIKQYQTNKKSLTCNNLITGMLKELKQNNDWLKEVNSQSLQMSLRNLDNAYTNFFRNKKGFPKFKSKRNKQSFQCPQHCSVDFENQKLHLPKIKNVKTKFHRTFKGEIKTITISKTKSGKYFVSILIEDGKDLPKKKRIDKKKAIGIDLGLKTYLVTSNGLKINNPNHLKKHQDRLSYIQYKHSKTKKGSKNREKVRLHLAKQYEKVTNCRNDFLHKITHQLVNDNQVTSFCVEDLSVKNMMQNHCLARSISDASWATFVQFLSYKCDWNGKNLIDIGRFEPSSKTCNICGTIKSDLTLKDRTWTCPNCESENDRDLNASRNIRDFAFDRQNLIRIGADRPESTLVGVCGNSRDVEARSPRL